MNKKAIIITGGQLEDDSEFYKKFINKNDIIITADYGTHHALNLGIIPQLIVGDMDSIDKDVLKTVNDKGITIDTYEQEKDFTDTEIAINKAITYNPDEIIIFGAMGDRLDHTLANIHLLKYCLEQGYQGRIINTKNEIRLINNSITIKGNKEDVISLLPLTEIVSGITTEGLYYPLKDKELKLGSTRGISNVMTGTKAKICIKSGLLLLFKTYGEL